MQVRYSRATNEIKLFMMTRTISLFLLLLLLNGIAYAQKNKRPTTEQPTVKTARLHIDGFMKSKSGAV
jgi:hypothetical protein